MRIKKPLLSLLLLAAAASTANAQAEPGTNTLYPRVGMAFAKFSGAELYDGVSEQKLSPKYRSGFVAGVELQHQFSRDMAASVGVLYSEQGTDFEQAKAQDVNTSVKANYLVVPVLAAYTTQIGLAVKAGLQPEVRVSDEANQVLNRVTLSLPVALSYEYHHFVLDLRYNIGLTHVYKQWAGNDPAHNATIMLTLGYGIEL